jgi:S-DNA-T family DNA segregation ATPase FtsK/SpoIIIE
MGPDADSLATALESPPHPAGRLVLIDDIDDLEAHPALVALISGRNPGTHVIATARRDLKTRYQHWARELCRSRTGLWMRPTPGVDADLWSTPLPRVAGGMAPGRGFLVADGMVELVQVMMP